VVALQVHGDLGRPEVVVLPQVEDLPDDVDVGGVRAGQRAPGTVSQPVHTLIAIAAQPGVVHLPTDAEVPAAQGDVAGDLLDMFDDRQATAHLTGQLGFTHPVSVSIKNRTVNDLRQF
jgi:hypothetical protein